MPPLLVRIFLLLVATTSPGIAADLSAPFTPGNLIVASFLTDEVFEFDTVGDSKNETRKMRNDDPTNPRNHFGPGGMSIGGPNGHLFVASIRRGTITEFDRRGTALRNVQVVNMTKEANPAVFGLRGLVWGRGPHGNLFASVCGAKFGGDAVFELDRFTLEKVREIRQQGEKTLTCPGGIGIGPDDHLYVTGIDSGNVIELDINTQATDAGTGRRKLAKDGPEGGGVQFAKVVRDIPLLKDGEDPIDSLRALAFDTDGSLYVSVFKFGRIAVVKRGANTVSRTIAGNLGLKHPTGMRTGRSTVDGSAEHLFVGFLSESAVLEFPLDAGPGDAPVKRFRNANGDLDPRFVLFVPNSFQ